MEPNSTGVIWGIMVASLCRPRTTDLGLDVDTLTTLIDIIQKTLTLRG